MKIFTKILVILIFSFTVINLLKGCKKGEDDPFFSLRSRKARVAGDWKISERISTATSGTPAITCTTTFNGSTETQICGSGNAVSTLMTQSASFKKDGTFTWHVERKSNGGPALINDYEGVWNFKTGVGKEVKNKEQIALTFTKITTIDASSTNTLELTSNTYFVYDITQLKNKEMIWQAMSDDSFTSNGSSSSSSSEEKITFNVK